MNVDKSCDRRPAHGTPFPFSRRLAVGGRVTSVGDCGGYTIACGVLLLACFPHEVHGTSLLASCAYVPLFPLRALSKFPRSLRFQLSKANLGPDDKRPESPSIFGGNIQNQHHST